MSSSRYSFSPEEHERELLAIIEAIDAADEIEEELLRKVVRRHPKGRSGLFSKSDIIRGFRHLNAKHGWGRDARAFAAQIRKKPVRTLSGVAPVTVLMEPFPCPGQCIFCPSDVRMPKSYLADEPGAQRAALHRFDPYAQAAARLAALNLLGHRIDKVELIILGGTWSSYPESYRIWFVKRCLDALNCFSPGGIVAEGGPAPGGGAEGLVDFGGVPFTVDGLDSGHSYNDIVMGFRSTAASVQERGQRCTWDELRRAQDRNESASSRCVGLVVETRPDRIDIGEVQRIRRLGVTKVQIGIQSLSDEVLRRNRRGHDVATTRVALRILRAAGFKIHAHWMPNLYGSSPDADVQDFERLFADPEIRPDELKIYPCSLIESAELMRYHEDGRWRPYEHDELVDVLTTCMASTPEYCRITRVIRDIPGTDIVAGNRVTNLREVAEADLRRRGLACRDIRAREVRGGTITPNELSLRETEYDAGDGREVFLQYVTPDDRLVGFLRLRLPHPRGEPGASQGAASGLSVVGCPIEEIEGSALIREVHVYGPVAGLAREPGPESLRSQHRGLGTALVERASEIARSAGFRRLSVISAIGTRPYYRRLRFRDGQLYQHLSLR